MVSPLLKDYIPEHARLLDVERVLEHLCDALQPELDEFQSLIDYRETVFDPTIAPAQWLPYIGQLLGLGVIDGRWIGVGLNPEWDAAHMREVILSMREYTARKGTEWGIREAVRLWLRWDGHNSEKLEIIQPFGACAEACPPNWWGFDTPYDHNLNLTWREQRRIGVDEEPITWQSTDVCCVRGDDFVGFEYDSGEWWPDGTLTIERAPVELMPGSSFSWERPWQHFTLTPNEWLGVIPGIQELNRQAWNTHADPVVFAWLRSCGLPASRTEAFQNQRSGIVQLTQNPEVETFTEIVFETLDGFHYGDWWYTPPINNQSINETVELTTFAIEPGHQFGDVWVTDETPLEPEAWYYSFGEDVPTVVREVSELAWPIHTETPAQIIVGTEQQLVGFVEPGEPNQEFELRPPFNYSLSLSDLVSRTEVVDLPSVDTASFGAIPRIYFQSRDDAALRYVAPICVHDFSHRWDEGDWYYFNGSPGNPGELQNVPVYQEVCIPNLIPYSTACILDRTIIREEIPLEELNLYELYPILNEVSIGNNWRLMVETDQCVVVLEPISMFWHCCCGTDWNLDDRSQSIDVRTGRTNLFMEFVWANHAQDLRIYSYSLSMGGKHTETVTMPTPLPLPRGINAGFQFSIPFRFETGARTYADHNALLTYLDVLRQKLTMLQDACKPIEVVPVTDNLIQFPRTPFIPEVSMDCCGGATLADTLAGLETKLCNLTVQLEEFAANPPTTPTEPIDQQALIDQVLDEIRADLPGGTPESLVTVTSPTQGNSVVDADSGLTVTTFEFSTGIGSREFGVGQIRFLNDQNEEEEVARPNVTIFDDDSVRIQFWGNQPVADGSFQAWIYRAEAENLITVVTPDSGNVETDPVTSDVVSTTFTFSTGVGSREFGVGQIREIGAGADEIEILRPEVKVVGLDSVELTFWGQEIQNGSFQVWIYQPNYAFVQPT